RGLSIPAKPTSTTAALVHLLIDGRDVGQTLMAELTKGREATARLRELVRQRVSRIEGCRFRPSRQVRPPPLFTC
ncbi:hypothetical protein CQA78_30540, partial [Klebsiella pneumoniae]